VRRLYEAIENGVANLADPMLKARAAELTTIRDQSRLDANRAAEAMENAGPNLTPQALATFAPRTRKKIRGEAGGHRRDHPRALAQRVEVDKREVRILGSKGALLRALVAASGGKQRVSECPVLFRNGAPKGIRTPVFAVKGRRPRPLDDGRKVSPTASTKRGDL
jgi:hypothetical protein